MARRNRRLQLRQGGADAVDRVDDVGAGLREKLRSARKAFRLQRPQTYVLDGILHRWQCPTV